MPIGKSFSLNPKPSFNPKHSSTGGFTPSPFRPGQPPARTLVPQQKPPAKPQPKPAPNPDPFHGGKQWIPTKPLLKRAERDLAGAIPGTNRKLPTKQTRVEVLRGLINNRANLSKQDVYNLKKQYERNRYKLGPNEKRTADDAMKYFDKILREE